MATKRKTYARMPGSFWLTILALTVCVFYIGIRLGGINVPLERIPWSVLVPVCALFCIVHSTITLGLKRAMTLLGLCLTIAFTAEYVGESTGLIFGPYCYTDVLGPKLFGKIPLLIPFAWYMMFYPSYILTNVLLEGHPVSHRNATTWIIWASLLSALVMTAWDLTMDPVMSYHPDAANPTWCTGKTALDEANVGHPAWVWTDGGIHFGVPLKNFSGWLGTAFIVFLAYRLLERKIPATPMHGWDSRAMIYLPIGVYGTMAIIDAWLGYPEIEDVHLISPFAMGIPFLFASFKLFAERTDLPLWPWQHEKESPDA